MTALHGHKVGDDTRVGLGRASAQIQISQRGPPRSTSDARAEVILHSGHARDSSRSFAPKRPTGSTCCQLYTDEELPAPPLAARKSMR